MYLAWQLLHQAFALITGYLKSLDYRIGIGYPYLPPVVSIDPPFAVNRSIFEADPRPAHYRVGWIRAIDHRPGWRCCRVGQGGAEQQASRQTEGDTDTGVMVSAVMAVSSVAAVGVSSGKYRRGYCDA